MKKILLSLLMVFILIGCVLPPEEEDLSISGNVKVGINSVIKLDVNTDKTVVWESGNSEIATVEDGYVYGISLGKVIITAYLEDNPEMKDTHLVTVIEQIGDNTGVLPIIGSNEVELGKEEQLTVDTNEDVVWSSSDDSIAYVNNNGLVSGLKLGNVTIRVESTKNKHVFGTITVEVVLDRVYLYYKTKILSIDSVNKNIELLNVPTTKYNDKTLFYLYKENEGLTKISVDDLYIGLENIYVQVNKKDNVITKVMIDKEIGFSNIRVAIRNSIDDISIESTLYHSSISLMFMGSTTLQTFDDSHRFNLSEYSQVTITIVKGEIVVSNNTGQILRTNKRIIFNPNNSSTIITSISRGYGNPVYEGNLEVSIVKDRLLIVNDINLERYLRKVVPSEMPSSWSLEALKAQAVAARTYAYQDVLNKSNDAYGYTVDDSVKSQVYNNSREAASTNQAIDQTAGLIMTYNGKPIQAYYYSSSSGITASGHEVWIKDKVINEIQYLIWQNLAKDTSGNPITFDYQSEESMLAFFKQIRMDVPDNSSNHRWRVDFTNVQLAQTIRVNLPLTYASTPESVLTYVNGQWVSKDLPSNLGDLLDLKVSQRGTSGVVVSLDITMTSGVYRIVNQYNIRYTIRPEDAGSTVRRYYASNLSSSYTWNTQNDSTLYSGFFAIEKSGSTIYFYGGGYGHGVGMSQYGAQGMARLGKSYSEILTTYYSNIKLTDISFRYIPLADDVYRTLLKS